MNKGSSEGGSGGSCHTTFGAPYPVQQEAMANSIMSSSSESSSLEQPPTVQYPKGQPPTDPYLKDQPPMDPPLTDFNPMRSSHSCPCVKDPPPIELPKDPLPIELPKDSHSSNESVVLV